MRLLALVLATPLWAAVPSADWLVAPAPALAAKAGWTDVQFSVDTFGRPWILHDRRHLLCPAERSEFLLNAGADGLAYGSSPSPLVSARGRLGVVPIFAITLHDEEGRPKIPFKPIRRMPRRGCRLAPGARGSLYALCRHEATHELYVLRAGGGKRFRLLLSTPEPIAAAAGDGEVHYAAVAGGVVKIADTVEMAFRHAGGAVRDLAYDPSLGLFYATPREVGRLESRGLVALMSRERAQVRVRDGSLYVFSEADWGISRISGL